MDYLPDGGYDLLQWMRLPLGTGSPHSKYVALKTKDAIADQLRKEWGGKARC